LELALLGFFAVSVEVFVVGFVSEFEGLRPFVGFDDIEVVVA
jgi:hypothetical protein